MIEIENLTYCYPNRVVPALSAVQLRIEPGEFVLVAGPSGAGKSTLLRCLNGLVPHFSGGTVSGKVFVSGHDVLTMGPKTMSREVGFVFQDPEAQAVLDTVEDELAFGLELAGLPTAEMHLRVEEVLSLLQLSDVRHRKLVTLSGGERQRLAIATAMAMRPAILVLDEPTSQLDPSAAEEVLQALARMNDQLGLTIVLVEQRIERIARHAERLVYLEDGRILIDAAMREGLAAIREGQQPPLARIAKAMNWQPMPLTTKEGLRLVRTARLNPPTLGLTGRSKGHASNAGPALLVARGVAFSYNGRPVLERVDLEVHPGEAVVLLGRNGTGKSTLLKCLIGLLRPSAGKISVNGRSVLDRSVAEISQEVAYLPQSPDDLLFADSVAEELAITLANHGLGTGDLSHSPESLLGELGLAPVAHSYPRDLSVGQRQRVALAAVMVSRPRLLLLDEPTRGLDYQAKRDLVSLWQRWRVRGMGLLLVTHDVELAAEVADRVLVLSEGRVLAQGSPAEVLRATSVFMPQAGRLFPETGWLTVGEVLQGLGMDGSLAASGNSSQATRVAPSIEEG